MISAVLKDVIGPSYYGLLGVWQRFENFRTPLNVFSIPWVIGHIFDSFIQLVFCKVAGVYHFPIAFVHHPLPVVPLISCKRHDYHGDAMIEGLQLSVLTSVCHKQLHVGVTQKIILWEPPFDEDIGGYIVWYVIVVSHNDPLMLSA